MEQVFTSPTGKDELSNALSQLEQQTHELQRARDVAGQHERTIYQLQSTLQHRTVELRQRQRICREHDTRLGDAEMAIRRFRTTLQALDEQAVSALSSLQNEETE